MKLFKTRFWLSLLVPMLIMLVSFGGVAQAAGTWKVIPSPNPSKYYNGFTGVATVSANDVWAVGSQVQPAGTGTTERAMTAHWNGTKWSVVPTLSFNSDEDSLSGVAAVSANDVWAVGHYLNSTSKRESTLIEHWNGTAWSVVASPNPSASDNFLVGAATVSKNDAWAVGRYYNTGIQQEQALILHWNGSKWSVAPIPNLSSDFIQLSGLAVVSASNVWAVGDYINATTQKDETLIEHWNGSTWSIVTSPNFNSYNSALSAVTALSAKDVWAVGYYLYPSGVQGKPLIEHWNGTAWSIVANPAQSGSLTGIAALSATDIWAVGTQFEHWNGTKWSVVSGPSGVLSGVTRVPGTSTCWAVGTYSTDPNHTDKTLTEYYS